MIFIAGEGGGTSGEKKKYIHTRVFILFAEYTIVVSVVKKIDKTLNDHDGPRVPLVGFSAIFLDGEWVGA